MEESAFKPQSHYKTSDIDKIIEADNYNNP